jgi:hypothetical protein
MSIHERKLNKNSSTGIKGLTFHPNWKRWDCRIYIDKKVHRQYFKEEEKELAIAWLESKRAELDERRKCQS